MGGLYQQVAIYGNMLRIGTFSCWLFGHKFCGWFATGDYGEKSKYNNYLRQTDYCYRCGIDKPLPTNKGEMV